MKLEQMLGVEVVESTPDRYVTRMKVQDFMLQPHGVMHGGISAYLAENAGSEAITHHSDISKEHALGLELTTTHLLPVFEGDTVETVATPIRKGGRIRFMKIEQFRLSDGEMFNVSQMTMYMKKVH
jgi:uncharacterized protein (TIGR00369 family)